MTVFQKLTIEGTTANLNHLLATIESDLKSWTLWAGYDDWKKKGGVSAIPYLALDAPSALPSATIFLFMNRERSQVFIGNIVPDKNALSPQEYNRIVQAFHDDFLKENAASHNLNVILTSAHLDIEEALTPQSMELLEDFARQANKSTGSSNPFDYQRWLDFIAASADAKQIVNLNLLTTWLQAQGFPNEIAWKLTTEYQFGIDLFQHREGKTYSKDTVYAAR